MKDFFRLLRAIRPLWPLQASILILSTLAALADTVSPWIYREVINFIGEGHLGDFWRVYLPKDPSLLHQIVLVVGVYALILLLGDALRIFRNYLGRVVQPQVWAALRDESLRRLQSLSMQYFYTNAPGAITEKINSGGREADTILRAFNVEFWPAIIKFLVAVVAIYSLDRVIAVGLAIMMVLYSFLSIRRARINKTTEERIRPIIEEQSKKLVAVISNQELIKQFNGEESAESSLRGLYKRITDLRVLRSKKVTIIAIMEELVWKAVPIMVFGYGGYMVLVERRLGLGDLVLFIAYIDMIMGPLSYLFDLYDQVQSALISTRRMLDLWDEPIQVKDSPGASVLEVSGGEIEFRGVDFYYRNAKGARQSQPVFQKFNLKIRSGETVAVIGPSGAGKSTLVKMLLRFYDPDKGAVLIDGQDISAVRQKSVRAQVATMMQDTVVFNDTLAANLRYAKPTAKRSEIERALRLANLYDFTMKLPKKMNTVLGEKGVRLSGGERQRLGIARALLKDAPILILDEATSSLDSENERQIQNAVYNLIKGKTTIIIAHRLSTVRRADRIIVLDKGKVIQQGSHNQLLKKRGYYSRLYKMQGVTKDQTFA